MSCEAAVVVASVTKTIRKVSPALSPVGALMMRPAAARPPPPNPIQSTAVANANRPVLVNIMDLLCLDSFGWQVQHRTLGYPYRPPPNVARPGRDRTGSD